MVNGQGKTFEVMLSVNCGVGSLSLPVSMYDCGLKLCKTTAFPFEQFSTSAVLSLSISFILATIVIISLAQFVTTLYQPGQANGLFMNCHYRHCY